MQFTQKHLEVFENLSYDKSPIHWDNAYARRTPFANVVVYGIAGVLYGLGLWSKGRPFYIHSIKGNFNRTLYKNMEYEYIFKEKGNKVRIAILHNKSELMDFTFEWVEWSGSNSQIIKCGESNFIPALTASQSVDIPPDRNNILYDMNDSATEDLHKFYLLDYNQIPRQQLITLLWSSYHVGMVWPGKQALYLDFKFKFDIKTEDVSKKQLNIKNLAYKLDERFNLTSIKGDAEGINIKISAFVRPQPVNYSFSEICRKVNSDLSLSNKTVLVLGASRGFGSVIARIFLLKGASVIFNYRTDDEALKNLQDELSEFSNKSWFYQGDMSDPVICNNLKAELIKKNIQLDILVCSASPPIQTIPFEEQSTEKFLQFINKSLSVCHNPILTFISILSESANVVNISSVYAVKPPKHFSHYVAAKWAIEGMTHALASEYPQVKFSLARLPRILTDQTNVNFDFENKLSAIDVADNLLNKILANEVTSNPFVIDF